MKDRKEARVERKERNNGRIVKGQKKGRKERRLNIGSA